MIRINCFSSNNILSLFFLPSHPAFSHESVSESSPEQGNPFGDGSGEEQVRDLDLVPGPQLAVHSVQAPHSDHPPSISSSPPFESKYDNKKEYKH